MSVNKVASRILTSELRMYSVFWYFIVFLMPPATAYTSDKACSLPLCCSFGAVAVLAEGINT